MDRFSRAREYVTNVNRSVLLAIGLVVVAGLIAATFIYGETENGNNQANGEQATQESTASNQNGDETAVNTESGSVAGDGQQATNGSGNEDTTTTSQSEGQSGTDEEGASSEEAAPTELAATGPEVPVLAALLLGMSGYLYRRSQRELVRTAAY